MRIVPARPEQAQALTALAFAAKAHWGYPPAWLRQWASILTVTPAYIRAHPTYVAFAEEMPETPVGFCAVQLQPPAALLDHLWVLPAMQRCGVGRALFAQAEAAARRAGASRLKITGDPHAEDFYRRMGAVVCGYQPAPMGGRSRFLPLLEKAM